MLFSYIPLMGGFPLAKTIGKIATKTCMLEDILYQTHNTFPGVYKGYRTQIFHDPTECRNHPLQGSVHQLLLHFQVYKFWQKVRIVEVIWWKSLSQPKCTWKQIYNVKYVTNELYVNEKHNLNNKLPWQQNQKNVISNKCFLTACNM